MDWRNYVPLIISGLLIIFQLGWIVDFIDEHGGIEHDGGWMLSISRSVAERGQYTTMVSTLSDPDEVGGINVDNKFDIQAVDGRIWFFTGNGIGPASILPDALVLKLFGTSFWALRAGPLIFYTLMLILAGVVLYRLAGVGAVILFHGYIFFYPHISIFLSYEAMGEVPGMVYVLAAYLVFAWATRHADDPHAGRQFLLAGLMISLALNAKLITLWSLSGIFVWAFILWIRRAIPGRAMALLSAGAVSLLIVWELVHLVVLTSLTNFELYQRNLMQRIRFILDDGSGLGEQIYSGSTFFWDKFYMLSEVALSARWLTTIIFGAIFVGGPLLLWFWRAQPQKQNLLGPIWFGWLANTIWFVGLAKTGWPRHFWFGLVLAMLLTSVIAINALKGGHWPGKMDSRPQEDETPLRYLQRTIPESMFHLGGRLLLVLILLGFITQPFAWRYFLPAEIVTYWQAKQLNNKYHASLPWIIIPRAAQQEVVQYLEQLPAEARVFYPGQHKTAEIPPQSGHIFYPLNRRPLMQPHPADVVILGPSLVSPWLDPVRRADLRRLVDEQCPQPAIANEYYLVCPIVE